MKLICKGKTKDVYSLNHDKLLLKFKDDATGADGVFDPGANAVGLTIAGMGEAGLRLSKFFFQKINNANIPTHYISADIDNLSMTVLEAEPFGKGVEVIIRYKAVGSFLKRYGLYCNYGDKLDAYTEITLKDDNRNDPLITMEGLEALKIMSKKEYDTIINLTRNIGTIIKEELSQKGLELYDLKLEFGKVGSEDGIVLIDEISGGNMRVYKDNKYIEPIALTEIMLS